MAKLNLKGTRTEANLMAAYAGESQATNKYLYYAAKAKKDGYVQIGNIKITVVKHTFSHESYTVWNP